MLAYNLFRTRNSDIICAVPEDRPVPPFVHDATWQFHGKVADDCATALPRAAQVAVRFNGFYIFHPFESPRTAAPAADAAFPLGSPEAPVRLPSDQP